MLLVDIALIVINQRHLINCIERLKSIDERLTAVRISINYAKAQKVSYLLVAGLAIRATFTLYFECDFFQMNFFHMLSMLAPFCLSNLSKLWFISFLYNVRAKFCAMNEFLIALSNSIEQQGAQSDPASEKNQFGNDGADEQSVATIYLHKEILPRKNRKLFLSGNPNLLQSRPMSSIISVMPFRSCLERQPEAEQWPNRSHKMHDELMRKMTFLCGVHDEICEIGKTVNVLFSFQMLILMAYAFMVVTTELYFVYCALTDQSVPLLFKASENVSIAVVYFVSIGFTCVLIMHTCWRTKIESNKIGIYMHRVANIVDDTLLYENVCSKLQRDFSFVRAGVSANLIYFPLPIPG